MLNKICLYWHTLRHLRFSQFYERLKFNLYSPKPDISPPPALRSKLGILTAGIQTSPSLIGPEEFSFLGEAGSLGVYGWDGHGREKLWRYNQHYFNDLIAASASLRYAWHLNLLENWVELNPPAFGVGWEPYPTSLRIVNWVKWSLSGGTLSTSCIQSLAVQVRYLSRRLEWHLLGNHILANAKAMVFAGLFFQGDEANYWLEKGLRILERELPEQVLQDGGHFERSPMYHSVVLEDLLDLISASQLWPGCIDPSVVKGWRILAEKMLEWLSKMTHPDGQISLFNDAAFNIAASPGDLSAYARSLAIEVDGKLAQSGLMVYELEQSGYIQFSSKNAVAILDVAPVGPDYLPGHGHADTLSFELSLFSQRIIVNGGTSLYGLSPERLRQRQTINHSTVEVGGLSSSEVWGGFRVARRAKPIGLQIRAAVDRILVGCSHNGYARLKGAPMHHREWDMGLKHLKVIDTVTGGKHKSIARFIFHPSIHIENTDFNDWILRTPLGDQVFLKVLNGSSSLESVTYAPEFGVNLRTKCLAVELIMGQSQVKFDWS